MRKQAGFTFLELVLVVAAVGLIGFMGVTAYNNHQAASVATAPKSQTPTAPDVTSTADLATAQTALDTSDLDATTTDSNELSSELSGL